MTITTTITLTTATIIMVAATAGTPILTTTAAFTLIIETTAVAFTRVAALVTMAVLGAADTRTEEATGAGICTGAAEAVEEEGTAGEDKRILPLHPFDMCVKLLKRASC